MDQRKSLINRLELEDDQRVRDILNLPPEKRALRLLDSEFSDRIIPLIPPEELFLTIKDSEENDIVSILRYSTASQINFFLDIDFWVGDDLDLNKFEKWIKYITQLDYDHLAAAVKNLNLELIALCFSFYVNIMFRIDKDDNREIEGDTIDGVYYFKFKAGWVKDPFIYFIDIIKAEYGNLYLEFLRSIFGAVQTEDQYQELRLRNSRLSSFGYPDYETAVLIYRGISLKELMLQPKKDSTADISNLLENRTDGGYSDILPNYPALYRGKKTYFFDSLYDKLDTAVQDEVRFELSHLSNCIIIASKTEDITGNVIRDSILRAKGYINLSIEMLANNQEDKALLILKNLYLKSLFQYANFMINNLRNKSRKLVKKGIFEHFSDINQAMEFLGEYYSGYLKGLFMRVPLYFYRDENSLDSYRDFECTGDIKKVEDVLNGLSLSGEILLKIFKISPLDIYKFHCDTRGDLFVCLSTVLLRMLWDNEPKLQPFEKNELAELINSLKKDEKVFYEFNSRIQKYLAANLKGFSDNYAVSEIITSSIMNIFEEIRYINYLIPDEIHKTISSIAYME